MLRLLCNKKRLYLQLQGQRSKHDGATVVDIVGTVYPQQISVLLFHSLYVLLSVKLTLRQNCCLHNERGYLVKTSWSNSKATWC